MPTGIHVKSSAVTDTISITIRATELADSSSIKWHNLQQSVLFILLDRAAITLQSSLLNSPYLTCVNFVPNNPLVGEEYSLTNLREAMVSAGLNFLLQHQDYRYAICEAAAARRPPNFPPNQEVTTLRKAAPHLVVQFLFHLCPPRDSTLVGSSDCARPRVRLHYGWERRRVVIKRGRSTVRLPGLTHPNVVLRIVLFEIRKKYFMCNDYNRASRFSAMMYMQCNDAYVR